jgi:hypothetical protein
MGFAKLLRILGVATYFTKSHDREPVLRRIEFDVLANIIGSSPPHIRCSLARAR